MHKTFLFSHLCKFGVVTNYVSQYYIFEQSNVTMWSLRATAKSDVSSPLGFSKNQNDVCCRKMIKLGVLDMNTNAMNMYQ